MNPNDLKQFMPSIDDSALRHFREMEDLARPSILNATAASLLLSDASVGSQITPALELSDRFTDMTRDAMSQFRDKYAAESALHSVGNARLKSPQDKLATEFLPSAIDSAMLKSFSNNFSQESLQPSIESAMLKSFPNNFPYGVSPVVDRQRDLEILSKQLLAGVSPSIDQQRDLEILSKQLLAGVSPVVYQQHDLEILSKQFLTGVVPAVGQQSDVEFLSKQLLGGVSQSSIDSAMLKSFPNNFSPEFLQPSINILALKALQEPPGASVWSNTSHADSLLANIEAVASTLSGSGASSLNDFLGTMRAGLDAVSVHESFLNSIGPLDAGLQSAVSGFSNVLFDRFATQVHTPDDLLRTAAGVSALTDFLSEYELDEDENQGSTSDASAIELTAEVDRLTNAVKSTPTGPDIALSVEQLVHVLAHEISKREPTVQQRFLMNYVIPNLVAALVQVAVARLMSQPPCASPVSEKQNVVAVAARVQGTGKATVRCGQGRLVIRLKPDHDSDAIATIANGTPLHIAQWQDGWALVEISDGETSIRGWVAGAFLKRDAEQHSATR
jgi:hypothetical protein